jgi:hypothetical protein
MKVVINCPDNSVVIDGVHLWVDCKDVHGLVTFVHFDSEDGLGWMQFHNDGKGRFLANLPINADYFQQQFSFLVEKWNETKAENDAKAKAIADANAAARSDGAEALKHVRGIAGPAAQGA